MGQIDVSDLLSDPDFVDKLTIIRRGSKVNDHGENVISDFGIPTVGCVQPVSGKTLQRLPDAFRVANVMSFWVRETIVIDGRGTYPDVIFFKGSRFAVQTVFDWTNWGDGWTEGTCVREVPTL